MASSTPSIWLASAACILLTSGIVCQKLCKSRPEWIKALATLGQPRKQKLPGTAIVCGGSIAGTVTARILADHFERVVIVDPEILDNEKPKTRIMQYNAAHIFLSLFANGARRLWPNFDAEFEAAGGRLVPADPQIHYSGVLLPSPYKDYPLGRLPDTLHPTASNITVLAGTVRGLQASADMNSIQSVIVRRLDGNQTSLHDVALVVDCTGTTQAGFKWLKSTGFPLPENLRCSYNGNLHYATLCFAVPLELEATLPIPRANIKTALIYCNMQGSSLVGLFKTENNTMQLLISDAGDVFLPRVASDVLPFVLGFDGQAPIPSWFLETVAILCENGNPSFDNIKIPTQSYVQYHSLPAAALPSNFIAIGDSNLQLNPVHGQGFTKIMLNGLALNSLLNTIKAGIYKLPRDFSARYFRNNAAHTQGLWDATRLHDYGFSSCQPMEGETKDTGRILRWFELKLISAATQDDEVASALWHVRHLLAPETALLAPTVLWKVLWTQIHLSAQAESDAGTEGIRAKGLVRDT
ncbi:hypothetical protein C8R44DRAFT_975206 [Mycena epipterygia]|nr:hypothetical protein C8R44DRAFT_975206 [Mycena epipterygia]